MSEKIALHPVKEEVCAAVIANLFEKGDGDLLFICQNDRQLEGLKASIQFFLPNEEILLFPDYDNLPYEKTSISKKVKFQRVNSHFSLKALSKKIILISNSSLIRKQPKVDFQGLISFKIGQTYERENLLKVISQIGYDRENVVSEKGEFSVRGGIIDIFPINSEKPVRLDFFGDELESIKFFNRESQITDKSQKIEEFHLLPAEEIVLNEEKIENFLNSYRKEFSVKSCSDFPFEAVKDGRKFAGIENYLPFFFKESSSFFQCLAPNTQIAYFGSLNMLEHEVSRKIQDISASYGIVKEFEKNSDRKNLAPNDLFLTKDQILQELEGFKQFSMLQFQILSQNFQEQTLDMKDRVNLAEISKQEKRNNFAVLKEFSQNNSDKKIILACHTTGSKTRIAENLTENQMFINHIDNFEMARPNAINLAILQIEEGFAKDDFVIITEKDLLGEQLGKFSKRKKAATSQKRLENLLKEASNFEIGDLLVHQDHGIGRFEGLETMEINGIKLDFIKLTYDGDDKLYLPIENIELLSKYGSATANLDKLGLSSFQMRKAKAKEKLLEIAGELIELAASRKTRSQVPLVANSAAYDEFTEKFPFVETEDQLRAIADIESDMASGSVMDRLVCGDVGFGKTEVAMRAAFIATHNDAFEKAQVAILVPTTLLAKQHFENFNKRFQGFNCKIAMLSRLVPSKEIREIKQNISEGKIDIVIGTHALLSSNIEFANLKLLIVDEEQAFGVVQKEKIKKIAENVHMLAMSATPIPRTLQMSLLGIRDLSLIATPPMDRLPIATTIAEFDPLLVRMAVLKEFNRGGKIFFVCPRISDLDWIVKMLVEVVPEVPAVVCHGQMKPNEIDSRTQDFANSKYSIFVSTSIIESGIDIEEANTIFIYKPDMFGLAALYQLRGRVGRGKVKAQAYLILKSKKLLTKSAFKRLEILSSLEELGAGFTIASHDMDDRGFGNLLGIKQAGNVKEVGAELYQQMLQDAIANVRHEKVENHDWSPILNLKMSIAIPSSYVNDLSLRLSLYRRISSLLGHEEIDAFAAEMIDRFGQMPKPMENLLKLTELKNICKSLKIQKIDLGEKGLIVTFRENEDIDVQKLINLVATKPHKFKLKQDGKLTIFGKFKKIEEIQGVVIESLNFI